MFSAWENKSGKLQIISGKFQSSGNFQNNPIKDIKQISLSHLIMFENVALQIIQVSFASNGVICATDICRMEISF